GSEPSPSSTARSQPSVPNIFSGISSPARTGCRWRLKKRSTNHSLPCSVSRNQQPSDDCIHMKTEIPVHLTRVITLCLILSGCATQKPLTSAELSKPSKTNIESQIKFGIFLTINPDLAIRASKVDLARIQLASSPVISADDILSYDFSTHAMKLRGETLARIPNPPVHGLPFVVVANGQRIYLGAFWTDVSSIPSTVPTITVNRTSLNKDQPQDIQIID